jgi:aryl-alcohol dehydrogenase-like predicted oxidoreductase
MERRDFLKTMSAGAGVSVAATGFLASVATTAVAAQQTSAPQTSAAPGAPEETIRGDMRYRALGRTGERVSLIGLGGYHIGVQKTPQESVRIIRTAIDHGINFLDNSWDYNRGQSEIRMGEALRDGYRAKAFLMTKVDGRTKAEAARQIDESLKRLQTDRIDLVQHHEVIRFEDPDRIFADDGAMQAFLDARQAGKLRFIGFTGHKDPLIHLRTLQIAASHGFHFDTVQMPLNVMDAHFRSFGRNVVPVAIEQGVAVLGMKPMGSGAILKSRTVTPVECLHYAMSLPTSTVITGMDSLEILDQGLKAVQTFQPLSHQQIAELLHRTTQAAAEGQFERFKTTAQFDATARHPEWLG